MSELYVQDGPPETDEQAMQIIRTNWAHDIAKTMIALYQVHRAQGKSVLRAWTETMAASAGVEVPEFVKDL